MFSDASQYAIGHADYIRQVNDGNEVNVTLLLGKAKVAPRAATLIPRLELCAAVEAAVSSKRLVQELDFDIDDVMFYCVSMIVLCYIKNTQKPFSGYVTSRINTILKTPNASQWHFVATHNNAADITTKTTVYFRTHGYTLLPRA